MDIIAIQGAAGSYHDQAARAYFGSRYQPQFCMTFPEVFAAVEAGDAAYGVAASGNTIFGSIGEVHVLLQEYADRIKVVGETGLAIHHCLIAQPGVGLEDITEVHSQYMALGQCGRFLRTQLPQAKLVEEDDTAMSVQLIKRQGNRAAAAVASAAAAEIYGMSILRPNIEDTPGNYTTFLILQLQEQPALAADKTGRPHSTGLLR